MEAPQQTEINVKEVFQVQRNLQKQCSRTHGLTTICMLTDAERPDAMTVYLLQEISESISQHRYRPQPQDMVAIRDCMFGE